MISRVLEIAKQVEALPENERQELLAWLADFELAQEDEWDRQIAEDFQPGGRLSHLLDRVREDVAAERVKPIDEVLGDA